MSAVAYEVFPDAERVCSTWIRAAGTDVGARVYSSLPKAPEFPLVTLERIGGNPAESHHLDGPRIQFAAWGRTKSEAIACAQQVRVAMLELAGQTVDDPPAWVSAVEDDMGMHWEPDPATGRDRYLFGLRVFVHGAVATS